MLRVDSFSDPNRAPAFKFETIGDKAAGVISEPPELVDDHRNPGDNLLVIVMTADSDQETRTLYARSGQMKDAIGRAVLDAGAEGLEVGGHLSVDYLEDRTLRNGNKMKVYSARYDLPEPIGVATLGSDPFGGGAATPDE